MSRPARREAETGFGFCAKFAAEIRSYHFGQKNATSQAGVGSHFRESFRCYLKLAPGSEFGPRDPSSCIGLALLCVLVVLVNTPGTRF
jgi:hypothetical protein